VVVAKDLVSKDFIKAELSETVSKLIGKFKQKKGSHAVVFDKKKYVGVISKIFLLKSRIDPSKMKISNIVKRRSRAKTNFFVPVLSLDSGLKDIAKLMFSSDVKILPVFDKGKFLGVVNIVDVLKSIRKEYRGVPVESFYSRAPKTVFVNTPVGEVINLFNKLKFSRVPVVNKNKEFLGMLTLGDLVRNFHVWTRASLKLSSAAQHQGFKRSGYDMGEKSSQVNAPIRTLVSYSPLYSIRPGSSMTEAINTMAKAGISSVVVVENRRVVGILTARDILKDYVKS